MYRLTIPGSVLALAILAGPALAMTAVDADGDGMVTFDELLVAMPTLTEDTWNQIDTDGNGMIDADEYAAAQEGGVIPAEEG